MYLRAHVMVQIEVAVGKARGSPLAFAPQRRPCTYVSTSWPGPEQRLPCCPPPTEGA